MGGEEEQLRSEIRQLKDELEKHKKGTLTSQKGQEGTCIWDGVHCNLLIFRSTL